MMNRNAPIAIGLVVVALGFVGLRWLGAGSDDPYDESYARGDEYQRYASRGGDQADDRRHGGEARRPYARESSRSAGGNDRADRQGRGDSRPGFGDKGGGGDDRNGSATTVSGSARSNRPATGGTSLSRRSGDTIDRSARLRSAGAAGAAGQDTANAPRLDRLRSRAPSADALDEIDAAEADGAEVKGDEDGVVFDPMSADVQKNLVDRGTNEDPDAVHKVEFLEDEGGFYAGEDSVFSFPAAGNINGTEGTINLVVEPEWNGSDEGTNNLLRVGPKHSWGNRMVITKNHQYLRWQHFDNQGTERGLGVRIDNWQAGDRHQVTVTYDAETLELWVDGQLVDSRPSEGAQIDIKDNSTIELGSAENRAVLGGGARFFDVFALDSKKHPGDL